MNPRPMLTPASLRSAPHPSPNRFPIPPKCAGNPSRKPCNRAKLAISLKLADCAGERLRDEAAKRKTASGVRDQENGTQTGAGGCNFNVTLGLRTTVARSGVRETYSAGY